MFTTTESRRILVVGMISLIAGGGAAMGWIWRSPQRERARDERAMRAVLGQPAFLETDSAFTEDGRRVSLVQETRDAIVVVVDTYCLACRLNVRAYHAALDTVRTRGLKMRFLLSNDSSEAAQYARLLRAPDAVLRVDGATIDRLRVSAVPTTFAIEPGGRVGRRWEGVPRFGEQRAVP